MKLGALDFSPIPSGAQAADALWSTIELASLLEELGYTRLWLGEHHARNVAHASPEIMAALVAGTTEQMHVGAAGVLLNYRNIVRTASSFRLLAALYPGRIDLGLARGGVDPQYHSLLRQGDEDVAYGNRVADLLSYLRQEGSVPVSPTGDHVPEIWMLGSRTESAALAAKHGTSFCFASFFAESEAAGLEACASYKENFQPSAGLTSPHFSFAVAGVCAKTTQEALDSRDHVNIVVRSVISGTPSFLSDRLGDLCFRSGSDEIIYLDLSSTHEQRCRTYSLLAQALH